MHGLVYSTEHTEQTMSSKQGNGTKELHFILFVLIFFISGDDNVQFPPQRNAVSDGYGKELEREVILLHGMTFNGHLLCSK